MKWKSAGDVAPDADQDLHILGCEQGAAEVFVPVQRVFEYKKLIMAAFSRSVAVKLFYGAGGASKAFVMYKVKEPRKKK